MLAIGQRLYGYCDGLFGRDSFNDKRVEAVGVDWVVAREIDSESVVLASGPNVHDELERHTRL